MLDDSTTIKNPKDIVQKFCEERDQDQIHNVKDLAIGIIIESGALSGSGIFIFKSEDEIKKIISDTLYSKKQETNLTFCFILKFAIRIYFLNGSLGSLRVSTL